ncbi:MAG: DNA polymerase III subunit beta [Candidatus Moranbacteria bacterium]|nr:DNA polymerase III subunit beta [Candidatus Moranbacteria bacterium]
MKVILLKNYLSEALNSLVKITRPTSSLAVLSGVCLDAKDGNLTLKVTNLEIGVRLVVGASVEKEGKVVVPIKVLASIIDGLQERKIDLEAEKGGLKIKTKAVSTKIKGLEVEDFPIIPKVKENKIFSMNGAEIAKAIDQVSPAMAVSNMRPDLASVYLSIGERGVRFVATDGFRLAEKKLTGLKIKNNKNQARSIIIPGQTANEMVSILSQVEKRVDFFIEESQFAVKGESVYLVSRIVDGNYPDYKQIIPKKFKTSCEVDKEKLLNSVKLVSLFAARDTNDVVARLDGARNELKVKADSKEVGSGSQTISVKAQGEKAKLVLNHRYLTDGINCAKSDKLILRFVDKQNSPLLIEPKTEKSKPDFLYLLSPIKKD